MNWAEVNSIAIVILIVMVGVLLWQIHRVIAQNKAMAAVFDLLDIMDDQKQDLDARIAELAESDWSA